MSRGGRKGALVGMAIGAGVLALSSNAWACTVFIGKMTIVGNASSTSIVKTVGQHVKDGQTVPMTSCPGWPKGKAKATLGGSVTVTVKKAGPDGEGCVPGPSRMDAGTYDVNYYNGRAYTRSSATDTDNTDGSRRYIKDCMTNRADPDIVKIGNMQVDEFGKGTGTYPLPASGVRSGPTDEAAVCVSHPLGDGFHGQQAPITIV